MAVYEGDDLTSLMENPSSPEVRRHYHAIDISESIWNRMEELGINQTQLAEKLGKSCSQVSRILGTQTNMTLQTLSELEHALGITIADTTPYEAHKLTESAPEPYKKAKPTTWAEMAKKAPLKVMDGGRSELKKSWSCAA
jgi:transcriptional regulator with XRE-family HTH domain